MNTVLEKWFADNEEKIWKLSLSIWNHPEIAKEEFFACNTICEMLEQDSFCVERLRIGIEENQEPNAWKATWGESGPVIGILGEYDSLPNLGQEAVPYRAEKEGAGHGCGHNQMAACSFAVACALKYALETQHIPGRIVYFGTPAEEILAGKVEMTKKGYFDGVDICFGWHPAVGGMTFDQVEYSATNNIKFRFSGVSAHAGMAPWKGRSALDAAELMNIGVNYLREHVTPDCRVHYVYTDGGVAPNVVPDHAEVYYYIRSLDENNAELTKRVCDIADGAAMMTGTTVEKIPCVACKGIRPVFLLNQYCYERALGVPAPVYSPEEFEFARKLYQNVTGEITQNVANLLPTEIHPPGEEIRITGGSTDVGNVSQIIPTLQLEGGGMVTGLPTHHWAVTAVSGTTIAKKALLYAAKVLSESALGLFETPEIIRKIQDEYKHKS